MLLNGGGTRRWMLLNGDGTRRWMLLNGDGTRRWMLLNGDGSASECKVVTNPLILIFMNTFLSSKNQ